MIRISHNRKTGNGPCRDKGWEVLIRDRVVARGRAAQGGVERFMYSIVELRAVSETVSQAYD